MLTLAPSCSTHQLRFSNTASTIVASLYPLPTLLTTTTLARGQLTLASGTRNLSRLIRRCSLKLFSPPIISISSLYCESSLWFLKACTNSFHSDVGCKTVANMIKGKTPEEIRKLFNIVNDFTPEEEVHILCSLAGRIPTHAYHFRLRSRRRTNGQKTADCVSLPTFTHRPLTCLLFYFHQFDCIIFEKRESLSELNKTHNQYASSVLRRSRV
jgi:hypothetical protein